MKQYSIGAVAKLTGLTVHNLRVWEKRHSAVETDRSESGRRIYSEGALQRLKLLKHCVDNGFTIGNIAGMDNTELQELVKEVRTVDRSHQRSTLLTAWAAGSEAIRVIEKLDNLPLELSKVERFTNAEHLASCYNGGKTDLLVIEQASLSAEETQRLAKLIKTINAPYTVLFYRYSRQQDVSYLKSLGVHTLKSPVDQIAAQELIVSLVEALSLIHI